MTYVSYEQAKMLYLLEYPQSPYGMYYKAGGEPENGLTDLGEGQYFVPYIEDVYKWLRDKKHIFFNIYPVYNNSVIKGHRYTCKELIFDDDCNIYNTYELALSAAISNILKQLANENR